MTTRKLRARLVLNHVLLHQTVVGLEAKEQMKAAGEDPDVVLACDGGARTSPASPSRSWPTAPPARRCGWSPRAHELPDADEGRLRLRLRRHGQAGALVKMYTLGHDFMPPGIHAGGLRYHGVSPLVSAPARRRPDRGARLSADALFEAAVTFARTEGIVPAPESSHAIRGAIEEAERAREEGKKRVILFGLSGHGQLDMAAYDAYLSGHLEDFAYPEEKIRASLSRLPKVDF